MSLELYERFERRSSVESSKKEGDVLGAYRPMVIDRLLRHLERIADSGDVDGWLDYVDLELTYDENKALLKREAGATAYETPFKSDRGQYVSEMLARQEEYEQRMRAQGKITREEEKLNRM